MLKVKERDLKEMSDLGLKMKYSDSFGNGLFAILLL
jgi:hypothetical protein